MTAIKAYLLRLILCALLVSLLSVLRKGKQAGRVLRLCGGCIMILTALQPLLRVDLGKLPDLLTGLSASERFEAARERNEEILRGLVEEQSADWVERRAKELGLRVQASVTARASEAGTWVPDAILLSGEASPAEREALLGLLAEELSLPPEKLRWSAE